MVSGMGWWRGNASGNRPKRKAGWPAHGRMRLITGIVGALAVCAALLQGSESAVAAPAVHTPPSVPHTKPVPVTSVKSHYQQPKPMPAYRPSPVAWPSGQATVTLPAASGSHPAHDALAHGQTTPAGPASESRVRAGALPIWLGPASSATAKSDAHAHGTTTRDTALPALKTPASVALRVLTHAQAQAAGAEGVLLSLTPEDSTSPVTTARTGVSLSLDYSPFASAFGGDWASRLRLVSLPACAVTTPAKADCRTQTPIPSTLNSDTHQLTGTVPLTTTHATPQGAAAQLAANVVAAVSSAGGGGGTFAATSLKPSDVWQAGGSSDAFDWSYPIDVPDVPGDLQPQVSLDYNSQSQDGLTSSTNNQASWVGDGFNYNPGFIERSYQSCDQNPAGSTKTEDQCWSDSNTLTLSLAGKSSILIKDDASGAWHPQDDADERIQFKTGAVNGAQNGEYWIVTTDDGTQYYFGLNQLPGFATGDTATNSVDTEPVFATASGQPCYNATFANSWCQQAYRWNLDYVVDPHRDTVSYFYKTDTGFYARDKGTTATTPYTRDSFLSTIQYGQRDGNVYSTQPAAEVSFSVNGRCSTAATGCATSTLTTSTAANWPDVPFDLNCAQNAACTITSPTFWSELRTDRHPDEGPGRHYRDERRLLDLHSHLPGDR